MSTIDTLLEAETLKSVSLGLLEGELPERGLFGTERFREFVAATLPAIPSQDVMLSSAEQVSGLLGRFLRNKPFVLRSPLSPVRALQDAVWELKTLDVRIFGWFTSRDCMVVDFGCDVKKLKNGEFNYSGCINQTRYTRTSLGFADNEFIQGTNVHDVLSNIIVLSS